MKYLILIQSNEKSRALWETLSDDERMEFGRAHMALSSSLRESGELLASEGLGDPALAKLVSLRDGKAHVIDGPYAEAKEYLAGFLLIDVEPERAVEIAASVPDVVKGGAVELRPVLDMKSVGL